MKGVTLNVNLWHMANNKMLYEANTLIYLWTSFSVLFKLPCSLSINAWLWLCNFSNSPSASTNWNLLNNDMRIFFVIEESVIEAKHPMASWENENKRYMMISLLDISQYVILSIKISESRKASTNKSKKKNC
jgi:hypothetical protein